MKEFELVNILNNYLSKNNILYANEIRMGIGIPDVMVVCNVSNDHIIINDYNVINLYNLITNKNVTHLEDLYGFNYFTLRTLKKYLQTLVNYNVIKINKNRISIKKILSTKKQTNISIEVKIKDWRNGFYQAQRYLSFSDYSYLALQNKYIDNVDISLIKKTGLGLLSINRQGINIINKAKKSNSLNNDFKYISISSFIKKTIDTVKDYDKYSCLLPFWI